MPNYIYYLEPCLAFALHSAIFSVTFFSLQDLYKLVYTFLDEMKKFQL